MHTQFDIPTRPMRFSPPRCVGSCHQGRAECPHPLLCGSQLSDAELADYMAEQSHDTMPATLDDVRKAASGVADGVSARMSGARDLAVAAWRALWSK